MSTDTELQCPSCKKKVIWNENFPQRPFCSKRCQLIDLGEWAGEGHKIAGSSIYDDMLSGDLDMAEQTGKLEH